MKKNFEIIRNELERTANNCELYLSEGKTERYRNEVGCLRGIMYIADALNIPYPKFIYYDRYIKPVYEYLTAKEPHEFT